MNFSTATILPPNVPYISGQPENTIVGQPSNSYFGTLEIKGKSRGLT
jgi:hypothetical protein